MWCSVGCVYLVLTVVKIRFKKRTWHFLRTGIWTWARRLFPRDRSRIGFILLIFHFVFGNSSQDFFSTLWFDTFGQFTPHYVLLLLEKKRLLILFVSFHVSSILKNWGFFRFVGSWLCQWVCWIGSHSQDLIFPTTFVFFWRFFHLTWFSRQNFSSKLVPHFYWKIIPSWFPITKMTWWYRIWHLGKNLRHVSEDQKVSFMTLSGLLRNSSVDYFRGSSCVM